MSNYKVCVVGLGYVGLPLAVELGKTDVPTSGLDINSKKIEELKSGYDAMGEVSAEELSATSLTYHDNPSVIKEANFVIVAVPTPIDKNKNPDLTLIRKVSQTVGEHLSAGSIVVFESTVYPGVTEDICVPIIEEASGLKCGSDWKIGYSPERINPGDKEHTIDKIVKVAAGMDEESSAQIKELYEKVCLAGVHLAPNIKTAEAAKVIENVQRDLNIGLMNELALIFDRVGINTHDVLEAAGTKWNFHKYTPGLVGGHCIGVDPYYLTHRAKELGYHPQIILAGRGLNDHMPRHVAETVVKGLIEAGKTVRGAKVLILGLTFKENVNDRRNSKSKEVIEALKEYHVDVIGYDPLLERDDVEQAFGVSTLKDLTSSPQADAIVLTVLHDEFKELSLDDFAQMTSSNPVFMDVKNHFRGQDTSDFIYRTL